MLKRLVRCRSPGIVGLRVLQTQGGERPQWKNFPGSSCTKALSASIALPPLAVAVTTQIWIIGSVFVLAATIIIRLGPDISLDTIIIILIITDFEKIPLHQELDRGRDRCNKFISAQPIEFIGVLTGNYWGRI